MVYAQALTAVLLVWGIAAEYVARALGRPTRMVWVATMALAVAVPTAALVRGIARGAPADTVASVEHTTASRDARSGATVHVISPANDSQLSGRWTAMRQALTVAVPARFRAWDAPLSIAWAIASMLALGYWLVALLHLRRLTRTLVPRTIHGTPVWVSRDVGPAVSGLVHYKIIVPAWVLTLSDAEQQVIVRHEQEHARAADPGLLFAVSLLIAFQPWNLALWRMRTRLRFATEVDCDARVLRRPADAGFYSRLLLTVYERSTPGLVPLVAFLEPTTHLERRIRRMLARKPALASVSGSLVSILAVGLIVMAFAAPPPIVAGPRSNDRRASQDSAGSFHLSVSEPTKRLSLQGKTGTLRIYNAGPAGLLVRNRQNNMTLGAHSTFDTTIDGETVLSIVGSAPDDRTDGTFEIRTK
jgi:bla regulator protein BlaR1